MRFQVGDTVGDYRITGFLGKGGMGSVFRVRHLISDREEAMKVVLPELVAHAGLADRFLNEIKVQASLDHPNITALHNAFRYEDGILMVMELVEGPSMEDRLRQGPIEPREAVDCACQVLSALAFAHARGIVHRDIKPANIIVTPGGLVKLTDFGIARSAGAARLTSSGMALGSLYYMSPEQIEAGEVDGRSDLYSLGVTLYEMVTRRRPFEGENDYAIMRAHLEQSPAPPDRLVAGLPVGLSPIVLKALAKDPAHRFQTADEFLGALRDLGPAGPAATVLRPLPAIDAASLARVEARLLPLFGPITRRLIAAASRPSSTYAELCRRLAGQIGDLQEREVFLRWSETGTTTTPAVSGDTAAAGWDPAVLESARQALAAYLGPIARILVSKAARRARTPAELYAALAAEIPSALDRKAFLLSVRPAD